MLQLRTHLNHEKWKTPLWEKKQFRHSRTCCRKGHHGEKLLAEHKHHNHVWFLTPSELQFRRRRENRLRPNLVGDHAHTASLGAEGRRRDARQSKRSNTVAHQNRKKQLMEWRRKDTQRRQDSARHEKYVNILNHLAVFDVSDAKQVFLCLLKTRDVDELPAS